MLVIIPSRMASTRLPNKPMAEIDGLPMIVQVWRRAMEADVGPVIVATDHADIAGAVRAAGGAVVMTRADHPSGSDRIAEALEAADPERHHDVVVNFQGDLPTIGADVVRRTAALLDDRAVDIGTPVALITRPEEAHAASVVKMVGTPTAPARFRALYFTRARAPWGEGPLYHHIGLYVWRRTALERFVALPPSALELREKLEQLRALEAGMRIDAAVVDEVPLGVDTEDDLERVRMFFFEKKNQKTFASAVAAPQD
jgi:3-deoxy-manno-octulosonate cytidylyltransferase (CMP-KDO synthetase)